MDAVRVWAVPVGLAGLVVADVALTAAGAFPDPVAVSVLVLVAAALALAVRRSRPVLAAVTASGLVSGYLVLLHAGGPEQPALEPFLVMLVAFYALGRHADQRLLPLGLAATGLPLLAAELSTAAAGRPVLDVVPSLVLWGSAFTTGWLIRRHHGEADRARERAARAEHAAAVAAEDERTRIARELHDVVTHSLSAMVVLASVERRLVDDATASTWQTLDAIERTGRTALMELRTMLGLLREADERTPLGPLPSLRDVEALVAPLRAAGHEVTLTVDGDSTELASGVDLSAYRILQEALSNTLRHAPGSPVRVHLDYGEEMVSVAVENDAPLSAGPSLTGSPGHGLVGMRERVRMYRGRLDAGPREDGGYRVHALLPLGAP